MTELAPKGPRSVDIIEIIDWPDIPFSCPVQIRSTPVPGINNDQCLKTNFAANKIDLNPILSKIPHVDMGYFG